MRRVFITGSPGVGKSSVARELGVRYKVPVLDIAEVAIKRGCIRRYIKEFKTFEVDVISLREELELLLGKLRSFIIEGHLVEAVPEYLIDLVVVLRLHPKVLEDRLISRGYPKEKIKENVLSEILDACLLASISQFGSEKVHEIDTTNKNLKEVVSEISEVIEGKVKPRHGFIDWIAILEEEGALDKYL